MHQTFTRNEKMKLFFITLLPVLITQLSYVLMNVFDTIMSGKYGIEDLAGVAIGSSLWSPVMMGLNGIVMSVTPIVGQLYGSGRKDQISVAVTQALYLSVLIALTVAAIGAFSLNPILTFMDLDPAVHHIAKHYLFGISIGIIPMFAANVLRNFIDAHGFTRLTMWITLFGVPVNFVLNYMFIFGKFGMPALGGIGAGYATGLTYWLIFFLSMGVAIRADFAKGYRLFRTWFAPSLRAWKEQLMIGVPIGLSIFFEASIFAAITLLMGIHFDTTTIAAHQAAINFTTLIFMIPLSFSMTLTILVAYEVGAKRLKDARAYTRYGVGFALGIQVLLCIGLFTFREPIAHLYTDDATVAMMTTQFFIFACFYQLSDAIQASLQGVLRGYKDVSLPFIIALISYWGIGLPSGYTLAKYTQLGPYGYWIGITIGLSCAAIGFMARLRIILKRQ